MGLTPLHVLVENAQRRGAGGKEGGAAAARAEYWRQLGRMSWWQAGMWFFGLFVVAMMVAARAREGVGSVQEFVEVRG